MELYLYSPSGPSWPVLGRTLPFTLKMVTVLILLRRSTRRHIPAGEDLRHRRRQNLEFRKDVSVAHATVRDSALRLSKECQTVL